MQLWSRKVWHVLTFFSLDKLYNKLWLERILCHLQFLFRFYRQFSWGSSGQRAADKISVFERQPPGTHTLKHTKKCTHTMWLWWWSSAVQSQRAEVTVRYLTPSHTPVLTTEKRPQDFGAFVKNRSVTSLATWSKPTNPSIRANPSTFVTDTVAPRADFAPCGLYLLQKQEWA